MMKMARTDGWIDMQNAQALSHRFVSEWCPEGNKQKVYYYLQHLKETAEREEKDIDRRHLDLAGKPPYERYGVG